MYPRLVAQINIKLPQEQKDKWVKYTEENHEFASLSQLIKYSVENEIQGEVEESGGIDKEMFLAVTQEIRQQLDQVYDKTSTISDDMLTYDDYWENEQAQYEQLEEDLFRRIDRNWKHMNTIQSDIEHEIYDSSENLFHEIEELLEEYE